MRISDKGVPEMNTYFDFEISANSDDPIINFAVSSMLNINKFQISDLRKETLFDCFLSIIDAQDI